jgi:nijmegen breakage syndrome protein 1
VPVTLTFSFNTKEQNADPFTSLYELLGPLDIKVLVEYERNYTTHLVAKVRNTSKGLQALVNGKYITHNDNFIKALVAATNPDSDGVVPLDVDFDANFPDPLQFLPPRGGAD